MANQRPKYVVGPTGHVTIDSLPPPNTARWTARRKAEVIAAIKGKLLTRAEALKRYGWTESELSYWMDALQKFGLDGLKVTKVAEHRQP
jgi:transposase-like protein